MPVQSRSRMISFRLTQEEHERFRELCSLHGIRSVSELARVAMNNYFEQPSARSPQDILESRVVDLENRLSLLALELQRIRLAEKAHAAPASAYSAS